MQDTVHALNLVLFLLNTIAALVYLQGVFIVIWGMMYTVRFNREINKDNDIIFLGGYAVVIGGRTFNFDFFRFKANVDEVNPEYLEVECSALDIHTFPVSEELTAEMLCNIESIPEFGCSTENDLEIISLEELIFSLPDREISIPPEVLKTAVFTHY